jgi:putative membrane protein
VSTIANIVIAIIALMHVWFLILEMFLWDKPTGRRAFGLTPEFATQSKVLAANQGLYNGFLSAGLLWGLILGNGAEGMHVKIFFLSCVLVAGLYGGFTATRKVLWIQATPALIGLALVLLS